MPVNPTFLIYYILPMTLVVLWYVRRQKHRHRTSVEVRRESEASGQTEPASLHPVIDPGKCIGCAACVAVCPEMPEHNILGLIHGKASRGGSELWLERHLFFPIADAALQRTVA